MLCSQIALVSRGSPLQFGALMSGTKRPRQQCQVSLGILREVETDRVVQTMDANDRALYRLLSQQIIQKRMNASQHTNRWERGAMLTSQGYSVAMHLDRRFIGSIWLPNGSF